MKIYNLFKLGCLVNKLTNLKRNLYPVWLITYLNSKEVIKDRNKRKLQNIIIKDHKVKHKHYLLRNLGCETSTLHIKLHTFKTNYLKK